jgi:tetratricopeptide (TPR) repeat protein
MREPPRPQLPRPPIDPSEFVACIQPLLANKDAQALAAVLRDRYTGEQITSLLHCAHSDARKVAALALGLVGTTCCLHKIASLLKDPDPMVNQLAEHAMWSIWFRSGRTPEANRELCRGTKALNGRDFSEAVQHIDRALAEDPDFAEAYNQRAIIGYLQERYEDSVEDCRKAVEHMPLHFGAWAGMGHCHAHLGRIRDAVECYRRALSINPHLDGIPQAIQELEKRIDAGGDA